MRRLTSTDRYEFQSTKHQTLRILVYGFMHPFLTAFQTFPGAFAALQGFVKLHDANYLSTKVWLTHECFLWNPDGMGIQFAGTVSEHTPPQIPMMFHRFMDPDFKNLLQKSYKRVEASFHRDGHQG